MTWSPQTKDVNEGKALLVDNVILASNLLLLLLYRSSYLWQRALEQEGQKCWISPSSGSWGEMTWCFEHQPLLAVNTNHWKASELSHWNKGIGNRRLMGCQLCRHDKPSKNPDTFSQKWIETSAGTHGKSARSHTWKTEQGSTGKHSLSSLYVNRRGIVKEAAKYLLERRRKSPQAFFSWLYM